MFNFEVNEVPATYIDHSDLINNAYSNQEIVCEFNIKQGLFVFNDHESGNNSKQRKRKHNSFANSSSEGEISDLRKITESGIIILKENRLLPRKFNDSNEFVKQFLDEEVTFPKINGYNNTTMACLTNIHEKKYLIPAHCKFFNDDVRNLGEILDPQEKYDLIVMDPPWRNKYIRRIKRARRSLGYEMLDKDSLLEIPLQNVITEKTLLIIWCTNSTMHQTAILDTLLPAWNMKFLAKWYWIKLNQKGATVCDFHEVGKKQPYEVIFIAGHKAHAHNMLTELHSKKVVFSVPSIIHSHKPPLYEIFRKYLPENPKCLELFARYLHPYFTSVGLEVLKLMDVRLYDPKNST